MRRTILWALTLLVLGPPLGARETPKDEPDKDKTPAQQYQALLKEYNTAQTDFMKAYQAAKTNEERQKVFQEKYPQADKFAGRFLKLAEEHPKDPAALDALVWVVTRAPFGPDGTKAFDLLAKDYVESPKVAQVCQALQYNQSPAVDKFLRAVMDKNPSHEAKGQAAYTLAFHLQQQADREGADRERSAKTAKEAEDLFEKVAKEYGDVKSYQGTLADAAKANLFEIRHLGIGKEAPEIKGDDIDGKAFKLSDYKGKVVVLDFWGNW
jgi:hypothetical protein